MAAKSEERLPADWTAKFTDEKNGKITKCYINVRTGQKFFSKEDLLRYVKMKRTQLDEPHPTNGHGKRNSEDRSTKLIAKENDHENSRGKMHSEKSSSKLVAKGNKHENSHSKSHSENSSKKPVAEENNHENRHGKRHSENSSTKPVAEESNHSEGLPDGWVVDLKTRKSGSAMGRHYKVYIEPLTGCKFFSMPEVLRHLESVKNRNSECERKTRHTETSKHEDAQNVSTKTDREPSGRDTEMSKYESARKVSTKTKRETTERVVVEKSTVDDLPPGWIKETKIKKTARGIRKDAFYKDPVSGYVFISKKDVFRYLETGQISKYAFKPRKGGTDDPELVTEEALPPPDAKRQKLEHTATRRRLFPVKESSDVCSPSVSKAEVLKNRRGKEVSAETGLVGAPTAEISLEQTAKMAIDKGAETKEISSLSGSALPKFRGSKKNQSKMVFADNGSVSTPVIDSLQGQRLLESQIGCSNGKTLKDTTKSVKKKKLNFPLRSSKRLAGFEPELVSNRVTIEQAPKNVTTESCKSKAFASSGEPPNKFKSAGSQAIPGEQLQKFKSAETIDDKSEQHISLFFGDSLLDPCLESAFKVLMGGLPVNSNPDNGPVTKSLQTIEGEKKSSRKTLINSMQSKKKQELNLPRRSSKRLAGFEPEIVARRESLDQAPKNVTTESCKSKGILAAGLTSSDLVDEVSPQLKANAGWTSSDLVDEVSPQLKAGPILGLPNRASEVLGLAKCLSSEVNIPASGEPLNKVKSSGNLAFTGGQSAEANGDKSEPHVSLFFGGSGLHSFKAMTGETLVDSVPDNEPVSTTAANILPDKKLLETKVEKSSNKKSRMNLKSKNKQELNLPRRSSKRLARLEPELVSYPVSGEQACGNATIESCQSEAPTCEKMEPELVSYAVSGEQACGNATIESCQSEATCEKMEPELVSYPVSGEQACGNATIESCQSEAPTCEKMDPCGLADGASQQVEAGHETMVTQYDCTDIFTLLFEESPEKSSNPFETHIVSEEPSQKLENEKPEEQLQKLENEKPEELLQNLENDRTDNENPDSHILFPFGDSWSDPCLEFAFKTLTGAIPVDENLAIQSYLEHHQLDPSNSQKDDSSAMPDFGPINSFQTEASHPFDAPEKQLAPVPQQQLPANPVPPPGNVSLPSCSGFDLNNLA